MQGLDERSAVRAAFDQATSGRGANLGRGFQRITARIVIVGGLIYLFDPFVRDYALTAIRFRSDRIAAQTTPGIMIMAALIAVTLVNAIAAMRARPSNASASSDPRHSSVSSHPMATALLWLIPVPCALVFAHLAQGEANMTVTVATAVAVVAVYLLSWLVVARVETAQASTTAT
jgi:hypothetical protein